MVQEPWRSKVENTTFEPPPGTAETQYGRTGAPVTEHTSDGQFVRKQGGTVERVSRLTPDRTQGRGVFCFAPENQEAYHERRQRIYL